MCKNLFDDGNELSMRFKDLSAANFGARKGSVARIAIDQFINRQLSDDPEMRKRYEEARRIRLAAIIHDDRRV
ncbi:MAG: hypothetical protein QF894_10165 [Alphaproteobacteria bacterium]|jgi:hypothetical protein|nr:hypothetical protein [Alphaproteobacteria bacterium]|tara:strand:+ start:573 stop:791 length:219 start_codon:yes stop_codon:yes gene_type:complete